MTSVGKERAVFLLSITRNFVVSSSLWVRRICCAILL